MRELIEEVGYQTKKYIGQTITAAMYDMMIRPMERFLDEGRKLFSRRIKKDRVVDGHGALLPEHIYVKGKDVIVVSPLEAQPKYRILDAANDVAALCNVLRLSGSEETADVFLKRYVSTSKDRELERMLPIYEAFQAIHTGVVLSERMVELAEGSAERTKVSTEAQAYFNLAVQRARDIPRQT